MVVVVVVVRGVGTLGSVARLASTTCKGRVAPVHIECPDVNGKVVRLPTLNFALGLVLGVLVPVSEPGAKGVVREEWNLKRERERREGRKRGVGG